MPAIGNGVTLRGFYQEDFQFTFNISGDPTQDDLTKAVTLDTASANTVKLAGDGDVIIGRLEVLEDRTVEGLKVATVSIKGGNAFPIADAQVVNVGDTIVGAGAGEVKAAAAADWTQNYVVEVVDGLAIVLY